MPGWAFSGRAERHEYEKTPQKAGFLDSLVGCVKREREKSHKTLKRDMRVNCHCNSRVRIGTEPVQINGGQPRSLHHVPIGGGGGAEGIVPENPPAHR